MENFTEKIEELKIKNPSPDGLSLTRKEKKQNYRVEVKPKKKILAESEEAGEIPKN